MRSLFIAAFIMVAVFTGCSKPDEGKQIVYPANSFSAKVDGKAFNASELQGSAAGSLLSIVATSNAGTGKAASITISLTHLNSLGAYPIDTATNVRYVELGATYTADTGAITIATNNDVHVAGSFAFEASDTVGHTKSITAGSFDIYK